MGKEVNIDKKQLRKLYVEEKVSATIIAKKFNTTTVTVLKKIRQLDIPVRSGGESKSISATIKPSLPEPLTDKNWVYEKYIQEQMSIRTIANLYSLNRQSIKKAIIFHGFICRDLVDARHLRSSKIGEMRETIYNSEKTNNIEYIKYLYEEKKNSISTICKELGISSSAVRHRLKIAGITMRTPWDTRVGAKHSKETLEKMSDTASTQIVEGKRLTANSVSIAYITPKGKNITLKSKYEYHYAEYLKKHNIEYEYEPTKFKLSNGKTYIPDFYLTKTKEFIEIKGYLNESQSKKYELFKQEYPYVKWLIFNKENLGKLGINITAPAINGQIVRKPLNLVSKIERNHTAKQIKYPDIHVYMVAGAPGSGKSWVCNQLLKESHYVRFDSGCKENISAEILAAGQKDHSKPIVFDPTVKISSYLKSLKELFTIHFIVITEDYITVAKRLFDRGGQPTDAVKTRVDRMYVLANKAEFSGTSSQVLEYLKNKFVEQPK